MGQGEDSNFGAVRTTLGAVRFTLLKHQYASASDLVVALAHCTSDQQLWSHACNIAEFFGMPTTALAPILKIEMKPLTYTLKPDATDEEQYAFTSEGVRIVNHDPKEGPQETREVQNGVRVGYHILGTTSLLVVNCSADEAADIVEAVSQIVKGQLVVFKTDPEIHYTVPPLPGAARGTLSSFVSQLTTGEADHSHNVVVVHAPDGHNNFERLGSV